MKVKDIMQDNVISCREDDSLHQAAEAMWQHDIGCLSVVGAGQRPVGMITDRDICMAAYTQGNSLASLPVSGAMARQVVSCGADDSVEQVGELLRTHQLNRLPVTDAGKLVGIVSIKDIAQAAAARRRKNGISFEQVGQTLAAIGRRRDVERARG